MAATLAWPRIARCAGWGGLGGRACACTVGVHASCTPSDSRPRLLAWQLGALEEDGSWRVIAPRLLDTKEQTLSLWLKPTAGAKVALLSGETDAVRSQTARVVHHILCASGMQSPHACFTLLCGTYYQLNGDAGMAALGEQMSEALGWVPSLCIIGGPEFGSTKKQCLTGGYTTSSVIFGSNRAEGERDAFVNVAAI
eukprot:3832451-Prymnesium_polylepis.2